MQPIALLILCLIAFISSFIQGLAGFGFPLLAVPLFSFFMPMTEVVPISIVLSFSINIAMLKEIKHVGSHRRELSVLLVSSMLFVPLGVLCLQITPTQPFRILIAVIALVCTCLQARGLNLPVHNTTLWNLGVGALCGFLCGLANICGPILVTYLNNLKMEKKAFRACIVALFAAMNCVAIVSAVLEGLLSAQAWGYVAVMLPVVWVGSFLGNRSSGRINEHFFKKLTLVLLFATSLSMLISGMTSL